jgi:chaperonin GroEL (HSP60 family)
LSSQTGSVPFLILREGSERSKGKDAQHNNIMAAKTIAEAAESSVCPKCMDKILVDKSGDIIITSDGRTTLDKMDTAHPACALLPSASRLLVQKQKRR